MISQDKEHVLSFMSGAREEMGDHLIFLQRSRHNSREACREPSNCDHKV